MINAMLMNSEDTVVTVTEAIPAGGTVSYMLQGRETEIRASQDIPQFHKIALRDMKEGEIVVKYGEKIGYATRDIHAGEHVHTQNMDSNKGAKA